MTEVPFNRAYLTGAELDYVGQAVDSGIIGGDGPFTKKATALVAGLTGATSALLTTSCTHALELSALLLDLRPGDEVIMPSFTFTSTANAFVLRGATPVFVDIRPDTLNLDERLTEAAITSRTRAVVVVHYAGVACEMATIMAIASRHRLSVIEDNAHGLGGSYHGRPLGSFGAMATQSFHVTKNVQCGEGGALVIGDDRLTERAGRDIREKGTDRARFFRGQVDKYCWRDLGSSYLPSELLLPRTCSDSWNPLSAFRKNAARCGARTTSGSRSGPANAVSGGRPYRPDAFSRPIFTTCCCPIRSSEMISCGISRSAAYEPSTITSRCTTHRPVSGMRASLRAVARSPRRSPTSSSGCRFFRRHGGRRSRSCGRFCAGVRTFTGRSLTSGGLLRAS